VAFQARYIGRFQQSRVVVRSVDIVTAIAADAMRVHGALNEIVALHPFVACMVSSRAGLMMLVGEGF
jgi:hypothetical protein